MHTAAFSIPVAVSPSLASGAAHPSVSPLQRTARSAPPVRRARLAPRACASATKSSLESAWTSFAEKMKASGESPAVDEWNSLFTVARDAGEEPAGALWVLDRMQETGRKATAASYEILLEVCLAKNDRAAAFLLVEKMWSDKVLLGDVDLPEDMEKTLRAILPPEAFD